MAPINWWVLDNFWAHLALFGIAIIAFVLLMVMVFIWFERRAFGPFQLRRGPNRASPWGALQPVADAIKVLLKEDIVPAVADGGSKYKILSNLGITAAISGLSLVVLPALASALFTSVSRL